MIGAVSFNPYLWLDALASIGGGYALGSDRRAFLLVDRCDGGHLTAVMGQITGQPERVEAVRTAIERRQTGEA